jgi:hypothetical protein
VFGELSRAGCIVTVTGPLGKPASCHQPPTYAGLAFFEYPRARVFLVFVCDAHRGEVIAARPMLERDRAELARRADKLRRVLEDGARDTPLGPLAVGAAARRLSRGRAPGLLASDDDARSATVTGVGDDLAVHADAVFSEVLAGALFAHSRGSHPLEQCRDRGFVVAHNEQRG